MGNSIIADPVDPPGVGRKESADLEHSLVPQRWHAGAFGESHGGTVRGDGEERVGRTDGVVSHLGLGILMIFFGGGCSGFRTWGISNMIIWYL